MPLIGRAPYFLPDGFFAGYGSQWYILDDEYRGYLIKGVKRDGLFDGPVEIWTSSTARQMAGSFSKGIPVGHWTFWDSKGVKITTLDYADGIQDGAVEMWYGSFAHPENAGIFKLRGVLRAGHWDGQVTWYYADGKVRTERTYEHGALLHTVAFYPDGKAVPESETHQIGEQDDKADLEYLTGMDDGIRRSVKFAKQIP